MSDGSQSMEGPTEGGGERARHSVLVEHALPVTVRLVLRGPHVFGYRLWTRTFEADEWRLAFEGDSEDGLSDTWSIEALPAGSMMAYWIGVAGPVRTRYDVRLEFGQKDAVSGGGTIVCEGETDAEGAAARRGQVMFP
jgi:hypothetical protein